jgi:hypothetical protein
MRLPCKNPMVCVVRSAKNFVILSRKPCKVKFLLSNNRTKYDNYEKKG